MLLLYQTIVYIKHVWDYSLTHEDIKNSSKKNKIRQTYGTFQKDENSTSPKATFINAFFTDVNYKYYQNETEKHTKWIKIHPSQITNHDFLSLLK